ncbi:hypothetical protein ABPG72_000733 [Tetrahymena utriculariae]
MQKQNQIDFENTNDVSKQLEYEDAKLNLCALDFKTKQGQQDNQKILNSKRIYETNVDDNKAEVDSFYIMNFINSKKQSEDYSDSEAHKQNSNNGSITQKKHQPSLFDQNLILNQSCFSDQFKKEVTPLKDNMNIFNQEDNVRKKDRASEKLALQSVISNQKFDNIDIINKKKKQSGQRADKKNFTININSDNIKQNKEEYSKSAFKKKNKKDDIERFYQRIKAFFYNKTYSGKTRQLTEKVRLKIGDKSDYVDQDHRLSMHVKIIDLIGIKIKKIIDKVKIPLFNPEQKWRILFNSIIVIFNCFYLYVISLKICFGSYSINQLSQMIHQVAQIVWIADMLIQMNTAMYHNNEFTEDRRIIMKTFIKEYFFFEVLPIIFENLHSENIYVSILFHLPLLLKMKGIMIMLDNLEFYILQMLDNHSVFQLFKLIMKMLLFGHFLACLKYVVIQLEVNYQEKNIWSQQQEQYSQESQITNYLQCMYWAFTVMLNVQQPTPSTNLELVFTTFCMILSSIAFGYILSAIASILSKLNKNTEDFNKDLNTLNQYMKRKKIEISLKRRANINLKKYYEQQLRTNIVEEKATLQKVNSRMLKELLVSSNQKVLKYCPFLTNLFSESTLQQICMSFEEVYYTPQETIVDSELKQSDHYLYIIIDGKVKVCENYDRLAQSVNSQNYFVSQQRLLTKFIELQRIKKANQVDSTHQGEIYQKGDYFGLLGFILDTQLIQKAQSLEYTTILRLSRKELDKIILLNQKDREMFMELKDRILYNKDFNQLQIDCQFCNSKQHISQQCCLLHFDKSNLILHSKNNFSQSQARGNLSDKRKQKYFHSLLDQRQIEENLFELKSNYGMQSTNRIEFTQQDIMDESQENSQDPSNLEQNQQQFGSLEELKVLEKSFEENNDLDQKQYESLSLDNPNTVSSNMKKFQSRASQKEKLKSSVKDNLFSKQLNYDDSLKISSFNEFRLEEAQQTFTQQTNQLTTELQRQSVQSLQNLKQNDLSISINQQIQNNQQLSNRIRGKSQLSAVDEDTFIVDQFEDDYISKKSIQQMPSFKQHRSYDVYFQDIIHLQQQQQQQQYHEKTSSQNSLFNIQKTPTIDTGAKKTNQSMNHTPSNKQKYFGSNKMIEKQSTLSSNLQKKKNSLKNSSSINCQSTSLQPAISVRELRNGNSKKEQIHQQLSKMMTKISQKSGSIPYKVESDLKKTKTNIQNSEVDFQDFMESEKIHRNHSSKHSNQDKIIYWHFDRIQIFQYYFYNNNYPQQIKKYTDYQQKQQQNAKNLTRLKSFV